MGLFISSGIILNCGNISSEELEPTGIIGFVDFELGARISDTLLAREHKASESILAKAFRLKI